MLRILYVNEEVFFVCIFLLVMYKKCKLIIFIMRLVVNFLIFSWIVKLKNIFYVGLWGKKYFYGNKFYRSLYICCFICYCGFGWFIWKCFFYCCGKMNLFNVYNDKFYFWKYCCCWCNYFFVLFFWGVVVVCSGLLFKKCFWKFFL